MFRHSRLILALAVVSLLLSLPALAQSQKPEATTQERLSKSHQRLDPSLPKPSAADLEAAFPDVGDMDLRKHMSTPLFSYLLLDQLEWRHANSSDHLAWDVHGWVGYDYNRLWLRAEGERSGDATEQSDIQIFYGRAFARWWDVLAGVRHDFKPGQSQTFAAVGIQGLAPYWFEVEATLYLGEENQSAFELELEYEWLLTNRLVLEALLESQAYARRDLERDIAAGFNDIEFGLRLRYEILREIAPYLGVHWERALGNKASLARQQSKNVSETRLVAGIRLWY